MSAEIVPFLLIFLRKGDIYRARSMSNIITDPCSPDPLRNIISALFLTGLPQIKTAERNFLFGDRTATTLPGSLDHLTHTSMILSTREDFFTRSLSVETLQMHTQIDFLASLRFQHSITRFFPPLADKET